MNSYIQVLSFITSFIYGILFYLLTKFNYYIIEKVNKVLKFIVTLVFIIDIVILYVYMMYKINNGYFHIYFVALVVLGFVLMYKCYKIFKDICIRYVNKFKRK